MFYYKIFLYLIPVWDHSFSRANQHNSRVLCNSYTTRYACPIYMYVVQSVFWFKNFQISFCVCEGGGGGKGGILFYYLFFGGGVFDGFQHCIIYFGMLPKQ